MSNKMRFLYLLVCLAAALGFVVSGCEVDDDADADGGTSTDGTTDGATDGTTDGTEPILLNYRYVRVTDISGNDTGNNPGADIDAIILTKAGGGDVMPTAVIDSFSGSNATEAIVPEEVLTLDAFSTSNPSSGATCSLYRDANGTNSTFFALGGDGFVTVQFAEPGLEVGDTLRVLEVGNCEFTGLDGNTGTAGAENVMVEVSVGSDASGTWRTVVSNGSGPAISATLTADMLPPVEAAP